MIQNFCYSHNETSNRHYLNYFISIFWKSWPNTSSSWTLLNWISISLRIVLLISSIVMLLVCLVRSIFFKQFIFSSSGSLSLSSNWWFSGSPILWTDSNLIWWQLWIFWAINSCISDISSNCPVAICFSLNKIISPRWRNQIWINDFIN